MIQSRGKRARALFEAGANCAQAVAGAFADAVGMEETELFKLASGFGGGVGRMREVCGAVSGMVIIYNILHGNPDIADKDAKDAHYAEVQRIVKKFEAETGSIICRTLLNLDKNAAIPPQSEARTEKYYRQRPCADFVEIAAQILESEL